MPRLLDRSPFPEDHSEVVVSGERVRIRPDQVILWVTLTRKALEEPNPSAVPFPTILDTGFNSTFAIHERHLTEWAGLRPGILEVVGTIRDRGDRVPLREANIWIHPNEPHHRDRLAGRPPYLVSAPQGIAVYSGGEFPRLPILGLRAIAENELVLKVNGPRREATLRTRMNWWWPFW
jgi:hypothetical protein